MTRMIMVDEIKDSGERHIHFNIVAGPLEFIETVHSDEAVHAVIMNLVDERMGDFLFTEDIIVHSEINMDKGTHEQSKISLIEYLEKI